MLLLKRLVSWHLKEHLNNEKQKFYIKRYPNFAIKIPVDCKTVVFFCVGHTNARGLWMKGLERVWIRRVGLGRDVTHARASRASIYASDAFGGSGLCERTNGNKKDDCFAVYYSREFSEIISYGKWIKVTEQYFPVVLFITLFEIVNKVWQFSWKLLSSAILWYCSLCCTRWF